MSKLKKDIYVTRPSLNTIDSFSSLLKDSWKTGILTHDGPLVKEFEHKLTNKLNVTNFVSCTNGTIALQMGIKACALKKKYILTSAFTWIATASAIRAEGYEPIFIDIKDESLNMCPRATENYLNKKSDEIAAIMPVHVFGSPCDVEHFDRISKKYKIPLIYDAAHAIGTSFKGDSVLNYGDISCVSLHSTKLLNCGEGGGCISSKHSNDLKRIRFFGHNEEKDIVTDGFNGKLTEVHAALGLANLEIFDSVLEDRKRKYKFYKKSLSHLSNIKFQKIDENNVNYSYFPIILDSEKELLGLLSYLNSERIFPRRYFYPSVNTFKVFNDYFCPISEDISKRILCLPLYFDLLDSEQQLIVKNISDFFNE
tara:strand:+ start:1207 stop:2310 length:1104 start_codon:yes stop_codon:yes gene_type:complete